MFILQKWSKVILHQKTFSQDKFRKLKQQNTITIFFSRPQCIDTYCMNTDEGRAQREEAKAKYLASLSKAKTNLANLDFTPNKNLTIQEQVDMIMSELQLKQKKRKSGEPEVI